MARSKTSPSLKDEVRGLYHGLLGEFTAARQALAKRLRQAGDPRHAEAAALRKPSISAAAVNQLFAREPRAMAALVGAGERARAAQRKGRTDPAALAELVATIRAEVERLTARGAEILAEASRAPGEAIVERLRTDLQALALDPATAPVAERRWLDEDLPPPGFELLAALQVAAAPVRSGPRGTPSKPSTPTPAGKARKATVHSLDDARRAAAKREERARLERLETARADLAAAETEAAAARRTAERALGEAERAERDVAEAERRAETARASARAARRSADEAAERAAAAESKSTQARRVLAEAERP